MRPAVVSIARLVAFALSQLLPTRAAPVKDVVVLEEPLPSSDPTKWIDLSVAAFLVLLGGVFAGLTIALMGLDDLTLKVTATSGEGSDQKNARKVLKLLDGRKHWVLVTLLLGNVITNETLPIVLDRSLGGGWPAVVSSTVLIVIFGEIIPQSLCVRYGLPIGATFAPVVWVLMWILGIVAWPTGKLLDWLLGEDHGTVYKKAGLKTLVTLHKTLGTSPSDRLNHDEVTILTAVLDLKEKSVGSIMTPMDDVFTMSSDTVLNEEAMDNILSAGYSRIPIHTPDNNRNFIGMLLVKILITYDPEDCKKVGDFALATLPETRPETSCLDIINFFQEGKSHMVLVSDYPGEDRGALGVVTLEDVIEEIIGEEIIDESDVYVDVHKAIRRLAPAPKARVPKGQIVAEQTNGLPADEQDLIDISEAGTNEAKPASKITTTVSAPSDRRASKGSLRRSSSAANQVQFGNTDARAHLRHLGPSNLASRPKTTRYNTVKIKPGAGSGSQDQVPAKPATTPAPIHYEDGLAPGGGVGAGLVSSAGLEARDGVLAVQSGYGSIIQSPTSPNRTPAKLSRTPRSDDKDSSPTSRHNHQTLSESPVQLRHSQSQSTLGSLSSVDSSQKKSGQRMAVRSGSITENVINTGGVRKVILEMTSSSSDVEEQGKDQVDGPSSSSKQNGTSSSKNKKKRKKRNRVKDSSSGPAEDTPLLGREERS